MVAQAVMQTQSMSAKQVQWFIETGNLECSSSKDTDEVVPYDQDALKILAASGRLG